MSGRTRSSVSHGRRRRESAPVDTAGDEPDASGLFTWVALGCIALGVLGAGGWWLASTSGGAAPPPTAEVDDADPVTDAGSDATPAESDASLNTPPRAEIRLLRIDDWPVRYQYSATFSDDPDIEDADRLRARWDFGGGSGDAEAMAGEVTFLRPGTYEIELVVTDPHGASDRTSESIEVAGPDIEEVDADVELTPGLLRSYHDGKPDNFRDLERMIAEQDAPATVVDAVDLAGIDDGSSFGLQFTGLLRIEEEGVYGFALKSDDGSRLSIGGLPVVDMDRFQAATRKSGDLLLEPGLYPVEILYYQGSVDLELSGEWKPPGGDWQPLGSAPLFHRASDAP